MDHQTFDMQKFGGISRYFANIFHYLNDEPNYKNEISLLKTDNFYLRNDSFSGNPLIKALLKRQKKQFKYNRRFSEHKISQNNFDIFHPTYYDPYFLKTLKKPFVLTVHDMIHEIYPEFFFPYDEFAKYKRLTINKADHIIAISQSTKHDLQRFYDIPDEKVTVVYHGVDTKQKQRHPILSQITSPYILFIGDRAGYKNFYRLVSAFKEVSMLHKDIKLVCSGSAFSPVESEALIRAGITDKVIQISATDEDLDSLYQHAEFYISPSILEGFGFPILEAFSNRCLVLLSDIPCFHEIAGDAAIYFNTFSVKEMAECMLLVLENKQDKTSIIEKGNLQLLKFPLEKSMQETKTVYDYLINIR